MARRELFLSSRSHKKGNVGIEVVVIIIILLAFGLFSIFTRYIFHEVNTDMQADQDMSNDSKTMMNNFDTKQASIFDNGFLLIFILLWIWGMVAAFMINSHPIFFVFTVIILIFVCIFAMMIGNSYQDITNDPDLASIVAQYPIQTWMLTHLLIVAIVVGFSIGFVAYAKMRNG